MMINILNLRSVSKLFFLLICTFLLACGVKKESVEKPVAIKIVDAQKNIVQDLEAHTEKNKIDLVNKNNRSPDNLIRGKPHAPIELEFSLPENINLKESMQLELSIIVSQKADNLIIALSTDDGVSILNNQRQIIFDQQGKGQKNNMRVSLLPNRVGLLYLYISATLIDGEQKQSRSFVIPLKIGNIKVLESLKSDGIIQQEKSGQGIVSMPAVETTD